jgi:hypothetical protein
MVRLPGSRLSDRWWAFCVAAPASAAFSAPLILKGTPDAESYRLNIFSTLAFVRNLASGVDPWFVSEYGFGIPLPSSTWLVKYPPALPASMLGVDALYAAIWLGGALVFGYSLLRILLLVTGGMRTVSFALMVTGLLSFSSIGPTYVDDWPDQFLGWALFPACIWGILQTLQASSVRQRIGSAAACACILGVFMGSAHHNDIVTFCSGMGIALALLLPRRPWGVLAVGLATVVALCSAADVLVPAAQGMAEGGVNPLVTPPEAVGDDLSVQSYCTFLLPYPACPPGDRQNTRPPYQRAPFFGLLVLVLAIGGAVGAFRSRSPAGGMPNDIARMIGAAFAVYTVLTLMPSWVMLDLPRMWMYRDGQTVLALVCAGVALQALWTRFRTVLRPALALHVLQMCLVAAPLVSGVLRQPDGGRLFALARQEPLFFDGLRRAGINETSRVMLTAGVERAVCCGLSSAGVQATNDFALVDIPVVNSWYRGGSTPKLGPASIVGRYGAYETEIVWNGNLEHLSSAGLDVLGITHVLAYQEEIDAWRMFQDRQFTRVGDIAVPGHRPIQVLRNDDAWGRAVLLDAAASRDLPERDGCLATTVSCRDFDLLRAHLDARLEADAEGSTIRIPLPDGHGGGRVLVTIAAGTRPRAEVGGERRDVTLLMDTFPTVEVARGERELVLRLARTDRILQSIVGFALIGASFLVAIALGGAGSGTRAGARPAGEVSSGVR